MIDKTYNYWHPQYGILLQLIHILYDLEGCNCGGLCHIITDDDNIYDEDIDWTLSYCAKIENSDRIEKEICVAICSILKDMSFEQRAVFMWLTDNSDNVDEKWFVETLLIANEVTVEDCVKDYDYQEKYIK